MNEDGSNSVVEEAKREAARASVFWSVDHPATSMLSKDARPAWSDAAGMLEGARESLAGAERMLRAAQDRKANAMSVVDRVCQRARIALRGALPAAVHGVIALDIQRAVAEVAHWREYVAHYEALVKSGALKVPTLDAATFAPPWQGEAKKAPEPVAHWTEKPETVEDDGWNF